VGGKIFGTVDEVVIKGTHADVVDFKFGRGEIDPAEINIQGQAYLLGVLQRFPKVETATLHFIIPRRDEVLTHEYSRADVETIRLRIKLIVEKAMEEPQDLRPNTEGCRYCRERLTCQALHDKMLPLAQKYAPTMEDFEMTLWHSYDPAMVEDPRVLGQMLNVAQVVDKWATAARKQAMKLAEEDGKEIPGYDLHYRNASMRIENAQDAYEALSDLMTPEEFMDACSITVAKLGKAFSQKLPRGEKGGGRGQVELLLETAGIIPAEEDRERSPFLKKNPNL
jgi:hypothetical protein